MLYLPIIIIPSQYFSLNRMSMSVHIVIEDALLQCRCKEPVNTIYV